MYKLESSKVDLFLQAICHGRKVVAPERLSPNGGTAHGTTPKADYHLLCADAWLPGRHTLAPYRPVEPLKSAVFPPRELVARLSGNQEPRRPKRIAVGVKNCDLSALAVHDYVLLRSDPVDPFYQAAREDTLIVSCDCTDAREVCFCPAVKEQPYAKSGFDINLAPMAQGLLVETGSPAGEAVLQSGMEFLAPADAALVAQRDANRKEMTRRVAEQAAAKGLSRDMDLQKAVRATPDASLWEEFAEDCVECGACNFVCCTCHCFLLADGLAADGVPARLKLWDSCLLKNFARVAGGANPRNHRAERLYNRFEKKFNFFQAVLGSYACDGCGRCAEACTGKIDIRDVLRRANDELQSVHSASGKR